MFVVIIGKCRATEADGKAERSLFEDEKLIWLKYLSDGPTSDGEHKVKRQVNSSHFADLFH
jgi:hypothetical protein